MAPKQNIKKTAQVKSSKQKDAVDPSNIRNISYFVLALSAVVLIFYCKSFDFLQDDSFITFRYVKNFSDGNGLVFNIGDKVEGYTCFLWVMFLSFIKVIGINFISASQTFGIIFSILTLFFTYKISVDIFPKNKNTVYNLIFSLISLILLISNGAFAYWTVSGMETALFAFLTTLGIYFYLKESRKANISFPYSALIFLLASLTRPEGNLIFVITILHRIIVTFKNNKNLKEEIKPGNLVFSRLLSKRDILWFSLYLIPALLFMLWRYSYYGYLFPNTFYAKTGQSLEYIKTGLDYFIDFAKTYGLYGILIAFIFINLKKNEKFYDHLYLVMIFALFSVYVIYIGGDVLRPARFFVPILPVFYILIQEGADTILSWNVKKAIPQSSVLITALVLLAIAYFTYQRPFDEIKRDSQMENGLVDKMKLTAGWLKSKQISANQTLTVAATTIGAISYYSDVTLIDMLGLTDKEIAHHPNPIPEISSNTEIGWKERHYNVDYVLSRKPDYIYFSTGVKPSAYAERGLFTNEDFLKYYFPSYFTIKEQQFTDCIYKRKTDDEIRQEKTLPPNPKYQKNFVNLYNQAMNTSRDKSKTQEAIDLYKQTLEIAPSNFGAPYEMIGDIYMQNRNKEKAMENYKKAVDINDFSILAHYGLYQMYKDKKDSASAQSEIDKILKYSPDMLK